MNYFLKNKNFIFKIDWLSTVFPYLITFFGIYLLHGFKGYAIYLQQDCESVDSSSTAKKEFNDFYFCASHFLF